MKCEPTSRFVESRLDRSGLAADDDRNIVLAQIGVVTKDDDDPQMRGQVPERGHHVVGERDAPDGVLDHGDVVQIVIGTSSITVRNLFAELRVAGVDHDPIKPWFETRARCQGITELPRPQERLLHGVLGVWSVTQDQVRRPHRTRVAVLEPGLKFVDVDRVTHLRNAPVSSIRAYLYTCVETPEPSERFAVSQLLLKRRLRPKGRRSRELGTLFVNQG